MSARTQSARRKRSNAVKKHRQHLKLEQQRRDAIQRQLDACASSGIPLKLNRKVGA
jgi:hypothetical protein